MNTSRCRQNGESDGTNTSLCETGTGRKFASTISGAMNRMEQENAMSLIDQLKGLGGKGKHAAAENADKVEGAIDKASGVVDEKTGGKHEKIEKGEEAAKEVIPPSDRP
jgi:hypothetical protein